WIWGRRGLKRASSWLLIAPLHPRGISSITDLTRNSISRRTDRGKGVLKHEDIDCTTLGPDCSSCWGLFRSKCSECARSYPSQIGPHVFYCQHRARRPFLRGRQVGGGTRQGIYARRHVR